MFDVPSLYENCVCGHPDCTEEECDALEAKKLHDFNHSVYAPNSIIVTCKPNETSDGLPDWTWYAEGHKFHRPIPKYYFTTVDFNIHYVSVRSFKGF